VLEVVFPPLFAAIPKDGDVFNTKPIPSLQECIRACFFFKELSQFKAASVALGVMGHLAAT
jgi:hypothetical protein